MFLLLLIVLGGLGYYYYRNRSNRTSTASSVTSNPVLSKIVGRLTNPTKEMELTDEYWSQAGLRIEFATGKCTEEGHTFLAKDIRSVTWNSLSNYQHQVRITVDDFHKPVVLVYIEGFNVVEPFVQRLTLAIRKAGGPDLNLI